MDEPVRRGVEQLLAKEAIRTLALHYARAVDAADAARLSMLWLPIRETELPWIDLGVVETAIIPSWSTRGRSQMRVIDHDIELAGDGARGVVAAEVLVELRGKTVYQSVRYFDEYRQTDAGQWRFLRRFHELVFGCHASVNPWQQSLAHWPAHQVGSGGDVLDADAFLEKGVLLTGG